MTRKAIPDETINNVLLKSRRRCCLCFWLDGIDEVKKGQIAHLDQDHENSVEDNLAFLCLDHHDAYDGKTSVSKGYREDEVRRWRDELYREMEYRFRTVRKRDCELTIKGFVYVGPEDELKVKFRLKNTGETEMRAPIVSIRLREKIAGKVPRQPRGEGEIWVPAMDYDPWGMCEERQDLFERNGRVGVIQAVGEMHAVLMPGHSTEFYGLGLNIRHYQPGSAFDLDYRVDAEGMPPVMHSLTTKFPEKAEDVSSQ